MVVPAFIEAKREVPRAMLSSTRFADQPFLHSSDVFALLSLVQQLQTRVDELEDQRRRLAEKVQHLDEQVQDAARVQQAMLPPPAHLLGLEIHTLYRPVESIGGDVYDFLTVDDDHLALCLADVCGHGLPAALAGGFLKRAFRGAVTGEGRAAGRDPSAVLASVNRDLLSCPMDDCQYVTGLDAVYRRSSRTLTIARGGMPYPILLREGEAPRQLKTTGCLLGALPEACFESMEIVLERGDCVLFYTDGLEALLCRHAREGACDNVADTPWFAQLAGRRGADVLADVAQRLDRVRRDDWPADDVSVIALCAS
jgi:serine phosphatase RsbU (regulator of sigma subunit)